MIVYNTAFTNIKPYAYSFSARISADRRERRTVGYKKVSERVRLFLPAEVICPKCLSIGMLNKHRDG